MRGLLAMTEFGGDPDAQIIVNTADKENGSSREALAIGVERYITVYRHAPSGGCDQQVCATARQPKSSA